MFGESVRGANGLERKRHRLQRRSRRKAHRFEPFGQPALVRVEATLMQAGTLALQSVLVRVEATLMQAGRLRSSHTSSSGGPIRGMKRPFLIQPLISMRAEEISLCLDKVRRQTFGGVRLQIIE